MSSKKKSPSGGVERSVGNPFLMLVDPDAFKEGVQASASLLAMPSKIYGPVDRPLTDKPKRLFDVSIRNQNGVLEKISSDGEGAEEAT